MTNLAQKMILSTCLMGAAMTVMAVEPYGSYADIVTESEVIETEKLAKEDAIKRRVEAKASNKSSITHIEFGDEIEKEAARIDEDEMRDEKLNAIKELIEHELTIKAVDFKVQGSTFEDNDKNIANIVEKRKALLQHSLLGQVLYATLLSKADSYVPGPVRAQIEEGDFSGAILIGKFKQAPDNSHLILEFNQASYKNRLFSLKAVAVDADTEIAGIEGDVDLHLFKRRILPFAASFLAGAAELVKSRSAQVINGTTTTITNDALSNNELALGMAANAAKQMEEDVKPKGVLEYPEVMLEKGTEMGIFFLSNAVARKN